MSKELVEVSLADHNFSFYVARLPEDVILEKLSIISPDTGLLSRIEYQNFIFSETIVNLERLFRFLVETTGGDRDEQVNIRNEVESLVCSVNPGFDPQILVISKSGVIKPASMGEGKLLTENSGWGAELVDVNPYVVIEELEILDDPEIISKQIDDDDDGPSDVESVIKRWFRTGLELEIKKFSKNDLPLIFKKNITIPSELVYKVYICRKCIVRSDHLFILIDSMGLLGEVSQEDIIDELYNICIDVNPFLKFGEIDISTLHKGNKKSDSKGVKRRSRKNSTSTEQEKTFSDVSKEELLTLPDRMKARIIGQDEAINQIVETVQIASCGLRDPEKPIAVYMLCGSTGTGKTLSSKVLAEELCGSRDALIRIDCSEYTQQHDIQKLYGSPPSYVGYEDGGYLTNAVQDHPFSVVLFDEIEKAHNKLFDVLLQIMDDARLTDGKGNVTSFKDCVILFTSNIGVAESEAVKSTMGFGDEANLTDDRRRDAIKKALKNKFRPEFLNRIDNTISFRNLQKEDALCVVSLILDKVAKYLEPRGIKVTFTEAINKMVFDKGFSKKYGARPLERTVEREVIKPLAQKILKDEVKDNSNIIIDFKDEELIISEVKPKRVKKA